MSSLVKLENITKIYHTGSYDFYALQGLNFEVQRGEFVAIEGSSGSGKSTLMNIIGFLDRCTTGNYLFSGNNVAGLQGAQLARIRNQKIGFIFQSFFLLPRLDALQNIMLPLFYRGEKKEIAREKALALLEKVGMPHLSSHKPNQLSGGQQQRVAIARALVGDPDIILADEPTGALDAKTSTSVMDLLLQLNAEEKRTIVLITHDRDVSCLCQRIATLKDGKILT